MRSLHLHGRPLPLVPLAVGEELGYVQHWIVGTGVHLVNVASEWPCWESAFLVSSAFPAGEAGPVGGSPHSFLTPLERERGMWNWGVGSPVSNWMSHLPVMEVKKVRKKQKCKNLALERTIVRFTLRDEAWFLMLFVFTGSVICCQHTTTVTLQKFVLFHSFQKAFWPKLLSPISFLRQCIIFSAEIKGGFFVPWQSIAALGLRWLGAAWASLAHWVVVEGYCAEGAVVEEPSALWGWRTRPRSALPCCGGLLAGAGHCTAAKSWE